MRETILINDSWKFFFDERSKGQSINIPHTWNNLDGQDGGNNYYRGRCRYEKELPNLNLEEGQQVYLEFEAVHNIADVYVNETLVAHNECGFSTFRANITECLKNGNHLVVYADNSRTDYTYPQFADFTFFGGIYRSVKLIVVPKSHISLEDNGSCGVRSWTTVDDGVGKIVLHTSTCGEGFVLYSLCDDCGQIVASGSGTDCILSLRNPHLWDGVEDPYLYTLKTYFTDDEVELKVGFRSYFVDPQKGFFLNGRSYPLRGVCRHQDRLNKGWAIGPEEHEEDMALIKEIGANTIRLSHYQHAQFFYDLCDKYGMIVWAEIPYISGHLRNGNANTLQMMKELIIQNMHHSSIVCWGISNEISMFGLCDAVYDNHRTLNKLCHELDFTRLTTIANLGTLPFDNELVTLTDLESYNIYKGWYIDEVDDNKAFLDDFHKQRPQVPIGYSEYGAEAIVSLHSENPKRGDYSEEYQAFYHEKMLEIFAERPYLWATHAWNMFDFACDRRNEGGVRGRNNKGLVTFDRKIKKESFYVYKAWWSKEPFVYVNGKRFQKRNLDVIDVKVYSNLDKISLYVNDKLLETKTGIHVFDFKVPMSKEGKTIVTARCGNISDSSVFEYVVKSDSSYSLNSVIGAMSNWFEVDCENSNFNFSSDCYSVKDSFDELFKSSEAREAVDLFLNKCASLIGIASEQLLSLALRENLKEVYALMSMASVPNSLDIFAEFNDKLNKIRRV